MTESSTDNGSPRHGAAKRDAKRRDGNKRAVGRRRGDGLARHDNDKRGMEFGWR